LGKPSETICPEGIPLGKLSGTIWNHLELSGTIADQTREALQTFLPPFLPSFNPSILHSLCHFNVQVEGRFAEV
jgi:hypothetical protein